MYKIVYALIAPGNQTLRLREFGLLMIVFISFILIGGGRYSLDQLLVRNIKR